jgi:hypothetical protein
MDDSYLNNGTHDDSLLSNDNAIGEEMKDEDPEV